MDEGYPPLEDKYVLYGSEFSLNTAKVRSYFRKKGIPFIERLAYPDTIQNFIKPRTGLHFVPVVQTSENYVIQDTTEIIDSFEKKYPKQTIYPQTFKQKLASLLLEVYADEWLIMPAMHYRWNFPKSNKQYIYNELSKTSNPKLPKFTHNYFNRKAFEQAKEKLKSLGITENTIPAIETSYIQLLKHLNIHFSQHKFLFGDIPSLGDFGFIGPLYAHLFRDPYAGNIMKKTAPHVALWVTRMMSETIYSGTFLENDKIPKDLEPIFKKMAREQIPIILDTLRILDTWNSDNFYSDLPRKLGKHKFRIHDIEEKRDVFPYFIWMWQRPFNYYHSLSRNEKLYVDPWLRKMDLLDALNTPIKTGLKKIENFIVVV